MASPSFNNEDKDAWLLKIELKREEPEEINKDEGIKKDMEDQAPAAKDILQLDHNLLTPTEIEAFKMIELARIQNKYLTSENILLKEHIFALKGINRKLEDLLRSMCDYPSPPSSPTTTSWMPRTLGRPSSSLTRRSSTSKPKSMTWKTKIVSMNIDSKE